MLKHEGSITKPNAENYIFLCHSCIIKAFFWRYRPHDIIKTVFTFL